jgi:hypothetical protein
MADLDPRKWTKDQWQAAGKHAVSYGAGIATFAAAYGLFGVSTKDAADIGSNLQTIYDGLMQVGKGVGGLVAVFAPIYAAWKAAHNASPQNQVARATEVITEQSKPGAATVIDRAQANSVINAVSNLPGVVGVVTTPSIAAATPSDRVVSDAKALPTPIKGAA